MNSDTGSRLKLRIFYGWWLVLAGFVIVACGEGAYGYLARQLLLLDGEELGGSVAQVGLVLGIPGLVGLLALLAIAPLLDRFGLRWPMVAGVALVGVAFLPLGIIPDLVIQP
jgi:MFS family permease